MELGKNTKYKKTLNAIRETESIKIDGEKKPIYSIFYRGDKLYVVLEKHLDGYMLYEAILNFFKEYKVDFSEVNVNLDSFIEIVDKKYLSRLLMCLVSSLSYVSVVPWTMKTSKQLRPKFNIFSSSIDKYAKELKEYENVAYAQTFARKLQDMPSNYMYPESFIKEVQKQFASIKKNVKIKVIDTQELINKKMNLLVGVGQSTLKNPKFSPKLLQIEYKNSSSKDKYVFVGKGVCFDSGGYNLKTGPHMRWMKMDMSGSAIVVGALQALVTNKIKTNVTILCPLVLNLINDQSQKPDDVIVSYSGKTVEIDNTDAEGRLILADALTYAAKDLKATHIFDVATLTGAMIYSLGETYTGTWATSDEIWNQTLQAAKLASEQVWRLPFHKEFLDMLKKSSVADIVNSCSGPAAGSSRAACFLKEFTLGKNYVHFDVAATADKGNVGTGIILRTLYNIAKSQ